MAMFQSLMQFEPQIEELGDFARADDTSPRDLLSAQHSTISWFDQFKTPSDTEIDEAVTPADADVARDVFEKVATGQSVSAQRAAILTVHTPAAVQQLVSMLTAYDWEFVERAKQLRGYTVAKILEETTHPDARIRLKALQMLGNVTEVALFTERVEVTKKDATEAEIEARLRERLTRYAIDVTPTAVEPAALAAPAEPAEPAELDLDAEIARVAEPE